MIAQEGEFSVFYACDVKKNVQCDGKNCYITGGPCHQTKNAAYAIDGTKAIMVIPMSHEEYDTIIKDEQVSLEMTSVQAPLQPRKSQEPRNRKEKRQRG